MHQKIVSRWSQCFNFDRFANYNQIKKVVKPKFLNRQVFHDENKCHHSPLTDVFKKCLNMNISDGEHLTLGCILFSSRDICGENDVKRQKQTFSRCANLFLLLCSHFLSARPNFLDTTKSNYRQLSRDIDFFCFLS